MQVWKIHRELSRLKLQIKGLWDTLYEPKLRRQHDLTIDDHLIIRQGNAEVQDRIALFLLYQPDGVPDSVYETCDYLRFSGFCVLIVSNCVVEEHDLRKLSEKAWRIIQRPNFGYDFGGYRDGILWLKRQGINPSRFLLLNDSIWLPVFSGAFSSWLGQLCLRSKDLIGAVEFSGHRRASWLRGKRKPFLGSFFLLFSSTAWRHPAFDSFWQSYEMTSNKHATIRRGERGLSDALRQAGLDIHSAFRREMMDDYVQAATSHELIQLLQDLVVMDTARRRAKQDLCAKFSEHPTWQLLARQTITDQTNIQNTLACLPLTCLQIFGVPLLKKGTDILQLEALRQIAAAADAGEISLTPALSSELKAKLNLVQIIERKLN